MSSPEDAVAAARERAAVARAAGVYPETLGGFTAEPVERVTRAHLLDWALIEAHPERIRSVRVLGAPITWVKRMLARALRQQSEQLSSDQTRFNLNLVLYADALERRVAELEAEVARLHGGAGDQRRS